jgi:plasmid stabilization system protein ParE
MPSRYAAPCWKSAERSALMHAAILAQAGVRELRKLSYRDYLIFYRVLENEVEIARIIHGKRDWVPMLRNEL